MLQRLIMNVGRLSQIMRHIGLMRALSKLWMPIAREVVITPRRPRLYVYRTVYATALLVLMCTAWLLLAGTQVVRNVGDMAKFGAALFPVLAQLQLLLMVFYSALLSASAVSHEKDKGTLLLLLLTRLTNQELVLGIVGVRAIRALGLAPAVWHLNEGHSAFLLAKRAREYVAEGMKLEGAWDAVRRDSVFTIHTPVSAGNERFDADLVRRVAGSLLDAGRVPVESVLELGLSVDADSTQFDMTAFSLRLTRGANAVSHLHAQTANATWGGVIDHPILGVTNGS